MTSYLTGRSTCCYTYSQIYLILSMFAKCFNFGDLKTRTFKENTKFLVMLFYCILHTSYVKIHDSNKIYTNSFLPLWNRKVAKISTWKTIKKNNTLCNSWVDQLLTGTYVLSRSGLENDLGSYRKSRNLFCANCVCENYFCKIVPYNMSSICESGNFALEILALSLRMKHVNLL